MAAEVTFAFNVMWKKKGDRTSSTGAYIARSVFDLLRILDTAEDVNKDNVDILVVHQHNKNGKTIEVLAVEGGENRKVDKPHVKLSTESELPPITGGYYYTAYPATTKRGIVHGQQG